MAFKTSQEMQTLAHNLQAKHIATKIAFILLYKSTSVAAFFYIALIYLILEDAITVDIFRSEISGLHS